MGGSAGLRLLGQARTLVAHGWCSGADARDAHGGDVEPWDEAACSWSLLGALVAVLEREAATSGEVPLEELAAALYALADVIDVPSLASWNDEPLRTPREVLDALDRAVASYGIVYRQPTAS